MRLARLLSFWTLVVLLTCWLPGTPRGLLLSGAQAQPSSADRVLATDLFQRGRALLVAGSYAEACPLLEESQRLDPAGGTLLNVALCHEQIGRIASAWSEFLEGLAVARREHREDRIRYAHEHISALEARLSRLVVRVAQPDLSGLTVERDGTPLGRSAWGVATPVDPGEHTLRVRAPGHQEHTQVVSVKDQGDLVTVLVPALLPQNQSLLEIVPPPAAPPAIASRPIASVDTKPAPAEPAVSVSSRRRRRAAIAMFAVAGSAALAATVCGVRAIKLRDDAEGNCQAGRCSELAFEQNQRAQRNADASTAMAVVSGTAAGAGVWLWLVREQDERVVQGAGVGLRGRF